MSDRIDPVQRVLDKVEALSKTFQADIEPKIADSLTTTSKDVRKYAPEFAMREPTSAEFMVWQAQHMLADPYFAPAQLMADNPEGKADVRRFVKLLNQPEVKP